MSLKPEDVIATYVKILEARLAAISNPPQEFRDRIDALKATDPAALNGQVVQQLLDDIPVAAAAAGGACNYTIGSNSFCLSNLSRSECEDLGGDWFALTQCALPPWP